MTPRIRKAAAVASTFVVLGGAGLGVANAAESSSGSSATTSKTTRSDRGPGLRSAELAKIAKTLGVTTDQLQAAVTAANPARPTSKTDRGADRAAEIANALGVETSQVQTILDATRPAKPTGSKPTGTKPTGARPSGGPGRGHGGPGGPQVDDTKLVSALATGLKLDEATVKAALAKVAAAHEAEHTARETARYAAIAKTLGLDATDVQKAFEAARPARPTS